MDEIIFEEEYGGVHVIIYRDPCWFEDCDPRGEEHERLGTMVCFNRRLKLGDWHEWPRISAFLADMREDPHHSLPIYVHDVRHRFKTVSIHVSTMPYNIPIDSGRIGFIIASQEKAAEYFAEHWPGGGELELNDSRVLVRLEYEVDAYNGGLNGDIYGWVVRTISDDEDELGDDLDFGGPYFDLDDCREDAMRSAETEAENLKKEADETEADPDEVKPEAKPDKVEPEAI